MDKAPFLFGVGLIENAHDETLHVEAIPRETLFAREAELQAIAVPAAPAGVRRAGLQRGWRG